MTTDWDTDELGGFESRLLTALADVDERRPTTHSMPASTPRPPGRAGGGRSGTRRVLLVATVLGGLLAVAGTGVAILRNPASFQPSGEVVVAGGPVVLKGSGCGAGSQVAFTLDDRFGLGAATADEDGLFSAQVSLPVETSPGMHDLAAACPDGDGQDVIQHAPLQVVTDLPPLGPAFSVGGSAPAGSSVLLKGSGCRAGSDVAFIMDGETSVGSAMATDEGTFFADVLVPASAEVGAHVISASCDDPNGEALVQEAELVVVSPDDATPPPKKP